MRAFAAPPISKKASLLSWKNANRSGKASRNRQRESHARISRCEGACSLCGDRPDGRGLSREFSGVVRGGPRGIDARAGRGIQKDGKGRRLPHRGGRRALPLSSLRALRRRDRKSTRLNSSHVSISYAVFCLKKKIK